MASVPPTPATAPRPFELSVSPSVANPNGFSGGAAATAPPTRLRSGDIAVGSICLWMTEAPAKNSVDPPGPDVSHA
jgi:hypothetical protein